jgi:hypothetical protein
MKRFRLAAWATVVGLGLVSGCSTMGGGSGSNGNGFFSRLFHRNNNCDVGCPCDVGCGSGFGGCCGPTCEGGPMVMDPWSGGAPGAYPPGAVGGPPPGALAPQTAVPPLAPAPPFTGPVPQAQPQPAGPVSRAK